MPNRQIFLWPSLPQPSPTHQNTKTRLRCTPQHHPNSESPGSPPPNKTTAPTPSREEPGEEGRPPGVGPAPCGAGSVRAARTGVVGGALISQFLPPPKHDQETMSSLEDHFGPVIATSPLSMRTDRGGGTCWPWRPRPTDFRPFFELDPKTLPRSKLRTRNKAQPMPPRRRRRRVASALVAPTTLLWGGGSALISLTKNLKCISTLHLPIRRCPPSLLSFLPSLPPSLNSLNRCRREEKEEKQLPGFGPRERDGELSEYWKGGDCCQNFAIVAHPPYSPSFLPPPSSLCILNRSRREDKEEKQLPGFGPRGGKGGGGDTGGGDSLLGDGPGDGDLDGGAASRAEALATETSAVGTASAGTALALGAGTASARTASGTET